MRVDGVLAVRAAFLAVCAAVAPGGVYGADTAWVEESISTHETGSWSQTVLYNRSTGLATVTGGEHTYVPNSPSAGDYVTLNLRMAFSEPDCGTFPGEDAQAAIRIASNGVFSVWTKTGWTDVAAQGITPISNVEYAVQFILDYKSGVYSVSVQDDKGTLRLLRSVSGAHAFPLAVKADAIKTITFEGKAKFRSLKGSCTSFKATRRDWSRLGVRFAPRTAIGAKRAFDLLRARNLGPNGRSICSAHGIWSQPKGFFSHSNNRRQK